MSLAKYVCMNGDIVPWDDAKVHVFSPIAKYATAVFEGIRGYWNAEQEEMYLFRLEDHMKRLRYSQSFMRFDEIIDGDDLIEKTIELVRANRFRETIHIRVMVFVDGENDLSALGPAGTAITAVPRPLPKKVVDGCSAQVSSWLRIPDQAMPLRVKCNANYNNGRLALIQARADGYEAAIMINTQGKVSEGPSMCMFMVRDGVPVTPSVTSGILESITRETLLDISREYLHLVPVEREIDRSELYAAEEAFFCGTGWEITPITSIDRLAVGDGQVGPVVRRLQEIYFALAEGKNPDHPDWRTPVYGRTEARAAQ